MGAGASEKVTQGAQYFLACPSTEIHNFRVLNYDVLRNDKLNYLLFLFGLNVKWEVKTMTMYMGKVKIE